MPPTENVYFDAATTAPLHPVARQALTAALDEGWADPARLYRSGRQARMLLDAARETVAEVLGARPDEVSFTASGTQAVQLGMLGALRGRRRTGRHLVHSAVEHSSVLHTAERFEADGGEVAAVPVDRQGRVSPAEFAAAVRPDTALAVLQSANHEVGTVQPVAETAELLHAQGNEHCPLLVDAAQSAGRLPVPAGWSLLTASAHKWGGPPGVGVLAVRKGSRFNSALSADEREGGRVPGFVNVPAIVAAAASLRAVQAEAAAENARLHALVERIRAAVPRLVPEVEVVGDPVARLPHIVTFSCLYVDGEVLLGELDRAGFAVSSGSSCTSSTLTPSHVLAAMGVLTEGNVRLSLPSGTTAEQVERFLTVLPELVARVREPLGLDLPAPAGAAGSELVVDQLGKRCPLPVIELAKRIGEVPVGGLVVVLADDEAARLDIPAWCEMRGQAYEGEAPADAYGADRGFAYLVRRVS
ncbi:aminotransferase class V-fold PLP-dependent enzyme [Kitasatospora acidiphila]|uniref:Aminotransferase class V-fold PLP-dependent enzyme n=1 Tax=Kitasatospora acidiphila TaxID=2567942 RepID=A0A540W9Q1_9ACTN|nr:aminotransferase class V-fold PLP-dependent enzyme [Kitasatospora acidiphila]TQF05750.1 aminotransferase class V-fold PLP-dependent enzyme [Kitasatospora acidiphila]